MNKKLLVFVSSTYKDLQEERQAAVQAVLKSGHIPAGMELFSAGDKSQLETIYNWIDECDVYMLILGGRYGSIDKDTGLSYTELEYDYARQKNKPYFAVVIKKEALEAKVKTNGTEVLETENPKLLKEFQEKVLGSISSFFEDVKDVKLAVYESLGDLATDPSLSGWISGKDVPDVSALKAEIESLKASNAALETRATQSKSTSKASTSMDFDELQRILLATKVVIPKDAYSEPQQEDVESNLHDELVVEADRLVAGVTSYASSEYVKYLYYNLFPKLQVLGLADNEKPPGTSTRRSALNKDGLKYLAWLKRKELEQS